MSLWMTESLGQRRNGFSPHGFSLLSALVLAKVMLVTEASNLERWTRRRPLVYPALFESSLPTGAAEELFVTQGAVSHQVKALEVELALKLFTRERQRLIITEAGREYLTVIRDALDCISIGTERLLQR